MRIIKNNQKQFLINKKKFQILKNKIDEYIKKHHDDPLQRHSDVLKTLQLLQQNCQFSNIRQRVEIYIVNGRPYLSININRSGFDLI